MECKLKGYDFKALEIILEPGETCYAERGALIYLESGIDKSVEFGKTAGSIIQSKLSGEALFLVKFNNHEDIYVIDRSITGAVLQLREVSEIKSIELVATTGESDWLPKLRGNLNE